MPSYKSIAMLDSGVGGLTVVKEIFHQLPKERVVYFGDTARMPYGPREHLEVREFAVEIIEFLHTQDIKMVIVACNSATAAGLPYYQEKFKLPIIGVIEPGVRAALSHSKEKRIGVIGTAGTIASGAYERVIKRRDSQVEVFSKACPLFVLIVENNLAHTPEAYKVAEEYLAPLKEAEIDTLILGCTHYPLLGPVIQEVMGEQVKLISSAEETARETKEILTSLNLLNTLSPEKGCDLTHRYFVSGLTPPFEEIGKKLLQREMKAYRVVF